MRYTLFLLLLLATVAQARDITVAWDDYSADPVAAGINVYYAEHVPLEQRCSDWIVHNSTILPVTDTQYTLTGLDDAMSFCIQVRGIGVDGVESQPSNAVLFLQQTQANAPQNARLEP